MSIWGKKFTRIMTGFIVVLPLFLMFACKQPDNPIPSLHDQSSFSAGSDQTKWDTDDNFIQEATGAEGTGTTTYYSSDESVALVDQFTGEVNILESGTTTITASNTGDESYNPASDSYILTVADSCFITTWQTAAVNESITIPTTGPGYYYNVDWGDGDTDAGIMGNKTHIYTSAGTYTVKISGTFPRIYFNNTGDKDKILTIENWGKISWTSMDRAFYGCSNLTYNALDNPNLSLVTDLDYMFSNASLFNGDIDSWDVSSVTDMGYMFNYASAFNRNIGSWNVGNVTNMHSMFNHATAFNQDIDSWNVSNVTDMGAMFYFASAFNQDIGSWNVGLVTNMLSMFRDASAFNQDIGNWNVGKVSTTRLMFRDASAFNQDVSGWNVSSVTNMSYMFYDASDFSDNDLSVWTVTLVTEHANFGSGWGSGNTEPNWLP